MKKSYLLNAIIFLFVLAGYSCNNSEPKKKDKSVPLNVLFISIDDLNDWIAPLGGTNQVKTPHLDRLMKEGMLFKKAYCASSLCNPSRAALMTGVIPSKSGIYYNRHDWRDSDLLKNALTIPQYFSKHGYYAAGAGKIYHNKWPDPDSWDDYWPGKIEHMPRDPKPSTDKRLNEVPGAGYLDWAPLEVETNAMGDAKSVSYIIEQLNKKHDKPFFLACGIYKPHLPWHVPQEFFDLYPLDKIEIPEIIPNDLDDVSEFARGLSSGFGDIMDINTPDRSVPGDHQKILENDVWKDAVRGYLASVSFADYCVGQLIDGLMNSDYKDNTVIVLWSDHGYHLGEKGHWRKETLWEEATRNILFIKAPGITQKSSSTDWPVSLMDVYPTMIDICSLPTKEGLDGNSLIDLLINPAMDWDKPVLTTYGFKNHSIRSKDYRYIQYRDGSEEFYNHVTDPNEWKNLIHSNEYKAQIEKLKNYIPSTNQELVPYTE
jgi:arylsulfatase A-like enzyme